MVFRIIQTAMFAFVTCLFVSIDTTPANALVCEAIEENNIGLFRKRYLCQKKPGCENVTKQNYNRTKRPGQGVFCLR